MNVNGTFDNTGCDKPLDYTPISEINVHWTYEKGDATIDMGYMNVEVLRASILAMMALRGEDALTEALFLEYWNEVAEVEVTGEEEAIRKDPRTIFSTLIDVKKKGFATRQDLAELSQDNLKVIARSIDPPHGPVSTYNWEEADQKEGGVHEEL